MSLNKYRILTLIAMLSAGDLMFKSLIKIYLIKLNICYLNNLS